MSVTYDFVNITDTTAENVSEKSNRDLKSDARHDIIEATETNKESAGGSDGIKQSRKIPENDKRYSEMQAREKAKRVDETVNSGPSERTGKISAEQRGHKNTETRKIEILVEDEKFLNLSILVRNKIDRNPQKDLLVTYRNDTHLNDGYV